MKSSIYSIVIAALALAIAPSFCFGQVVYNTGTQGCCDLLDAHYTLVDAPAGVPLGNVYSAPLACGWHGCWITPLPGSSWIDPTGTDDWGSPDGNYTYRQTFTLTSTTGASLTGEFAADNEVCVTLNAGPAQCTVGGIWGFTQYSPFAFTTGFQVGTNTLDFVVYNIDGPTGLDVVISGATTEKKLHNFGIGSRDGTGPQAGLIFDAAGNLYGTTKTGGTYNSGTVFELTPTEGGGWTEKKLHNFGIDDKDGTQPMAGLTFDAAGKLYGTTYQGGDYNGGTVFELTPTEAGWAEKKLHNFGIHSTDGVHPMAGVIFDAVGHLYGTTYQGGDYNAGTVFELTPTQGGVWSEKKLHNFGLTAKDGIYPRGGLIFNAAGNLYGTTYEGGSGPCSSGCGTVFALTPNGSGGWTEKKLHNFGINGTDGMNPMAGLILDAAGNLYGTTWQGGDHSGGTIFELTPKRGGGGWIEKKLHSFGINDKDGTQPMNGLIADAAGNLFGTTYQGGDYNNGTVFELTPNGSGAWTQRKLHSFGINDTDATLPQAGLILDAVGNLYGTTTTGGAHGGGTVFELAR